MMTIVPSIVDVFCRFTCVNTFLYSHTEDALYCTGSQYLLMAYLETMQAIKRASGMLQGAEANRCVGLPQ
jgi:hypothetical protein